MKKTVVKYWIAATLLTFAFIACENHQMMFPKEMSDLLSETINKQYERYRQIDGMGGPGFEIDSIYIIGNKLIEIIGTPDFASQYTQFCYRYGNSNFLLKGRLKEENLRLLIKIMQYEALNDACLRFHQSHFQVDLVGIKPNENTIEVNKVEEIELFPIFTSSKIDFTPIIIIDCDTLRYNGNSYDYHLSTKDTGRHIIETEVIIKRWGDVRKYNPSFIINVK